MNQRIYVYIYIYIYIDIYIYIYIYIYIRLDLEVKEMTFKTQKDKTKYMEKKMSLEKCYKMVVLTSQSDFKMMISKGFFRFIKKAKQIMFVGCSLFIGSPRKLNLCIKVSGAQTYIYIYIYIYIYY